jgi:hypothetical protein
VLRLAGKLDQEPISLQALADHVFSYRWFGFPGRTSAVTLAMS